MHEKLLGLLSLRAQSSDDVWLDAVLSVVPSTARTVINFFDTKVHIYAFIMLILNDANKINTF